MRVATEDVMEDWVAQYIWRSGSQIIIGRTTETKHLTEDNAWTKDYDYNWRTDDD